MKKIHSTFLPVSRLSNIKYIKPDCQRSVDHNHVNKLYKYQVAHYKKYNEFFFTNPITFAKFNKQNYILDGQHRLECITKINHSEYPDFNVPIVLLNVSSMEELDEKYVAINQNSPVPLPKNISDWKDFGKHIEEYITTHYSVYFSTNNRPQMPNFNKQKLIEYINNEDISHKVNNDYKRFIEEMGNLNTFYLQGYSVHLSKYFSGNIDRGIKKAYDKQPNNPFILGIFHDFAWILRVVSRMNNDIQYELMNHAPTHYRVKIKKNTRREVWNK